MVCPILISVFVTPGASAERAGQVPEAKAAAVAVPDRRNERRVVMIAPSRAKSSKSGSGGAQVVADLSTRNAFTGIPRLGGAGKIRFPRIATFFGALVPCFGNAPRLSLSPFEAVALRDDGRGDFGALRTKRS